VELIVFTTTATNKAIIDWM